MRRDAGLSSGRHWLRIAVAVAVAALVGVALPGTAPGSSDPCTRTLSNPGTSIGSSVRDVICGTGGNDRLEGRGGGDELRGFGGKDELIGEGGSDELLGSSGDDSLFGRDGNDVLVGGTGFDGAHADAGNDSIQLRDGQLDRTATLSVSCGDGTDSLDMDLLDAGISFSLPGFSAAILALDCEHITVGAIDEGRNVAISRRSRRVSPRGLTTVGLRCPRSLTSRCRGRLKLQLASRRSLRRPASGTRYSIRPGTSRRVRVRLSRRDRRTLHSRRSARGVVTSVEAGQHGSKTTFETVRLRASR